MMRARQAHSWLGLTDKPRWRIRLGQMIRRWLYRWGLD